MSLEVRYKFHGQIISGKFEFKERERENFALVCRNQYDQDVELVLQSPEKDRSDQQRKYYYGVIVKMLCAVEGYDKDDMNEILAKKHLSFEIAIKDGEPEKFYRRPSSLNTKETEAYHEKCRQYAMEKWNLYIPLPNEVEGKYDYY